MNTPQGHTPSPIAIDLAKNPNDTDPADISELVDLKHAFTQGFGFEEYEVYEDSVLEVSKVPSAEVAMHRIDFFYKKDLLDRSSDSQIMLSLFRGGKK